VRNFLYIFLYIFVLFTSATQHKEIYFSTYPCPLSELSDFGQSEQTRAMDERATKEQQFNW